MAGDSERLDLILLGATGFTGIHCIPYLHKLTKEDGRNLTWGISGRSEDKLKEALKKMGEVVGSDLSNIPIILSNIKDDKSLLELAKKAKTIISCCGPYRFLGEPVIKACVEAGTNYVDVTGEPEFMEKMLLKYNKAAEEKGVYIVSACGFDSIPNDMGSIFVQNHFNGTLNSIQSYLEFWEEGGSVPGPSANYGTWETLVHSLSNSSELKEIRKELHLKKFPALTPKLQQKTLPHCPKIVEGWSLPFPGADRSIMRRTQQYLYENENKRPVQIDTQMVCKKFYEMCGLIVCFLIMTTLVKFSFGKRLLLNYPHIFTFGMFRKGVNPSEEAIKRSRFQITFYGEGWNEKLADKDDQYATPPNKCIVARVKGSNPGYGTTCVCLVASAVVMATEKDKMPVKGGVYTTGAAFGKTSLIDILNDNGVTFDVIDEKDI